LIIGIKKAQIKLNEIRENRKRFGKNKKYLKQIKETICNKEKNIEEHIECYKKEYSNIIEKYAFPCNEMLEIIYSKHFQKALIS